MQPGSAERARHVAATLATLDLDPIESIHLDATAGRRGPEGNARDARYRALDAAAARYGAAAILLGHTLDDQAETVLLGLARGSGARSLSGMARRSGRYRRPLLRLTRTAVRAAIPASLTPWEDPHNADPVFARSRVRHTVLPVLEAELGPGVAQALARTADLLRADADALDDLSADGPWHDESALAVSELTQLSRAVRWRVLKRAAIAAGCPPTDLTAAHIEAIDSLIVRWRGQAGIDLPGAIRARRNGGRLTFEPLP
jgi:tRNA(Ile)-lysidine synthetase-like protein